MHYPFKVGQHNPNTFLIRTYVGGELVGTIDEIDHPLLWIVPFAGFTLVGILSLVNAFLKFLPPGANYYIMLISCALLGAAVSGFITELIKGRGQYVYISMGAALLVGAITFLAGYGFFKSNLIVGTSEATVPFFSELISNVTLTLLPGVFTGALVGGGIGIIPDETPVEPIEPLVDTVVVSPDKRTGYEKVCRRCSQLMPFDSLFCSQCGGTLKKRRTNQIKYCRFCGNKLYFLGEHCPDCGKEINIISRPKVFVSDQ